MLSLRTVASSCCLACLLSIAACGGSDDGESDDGSAGKGGSAADSGKGGSGGKAGTGGQGGSGGKAGSAAAGSGGTSGGGSAGNGGAGNAAGSGGSSGGGATDPSAELYDPDRLPRFDIDLPDESMDALAADPDTYAHGTLHYGSETVADVGIRIKGEATKRTLDKKAAFKIKFDEFVDKQEFRGLRRLTLNNSVEDPSFIAERLAFYMFRLAQLPSPRANSALVYVNGEYFGVYANIETEDKTFLRRWFDSDAGNLYEEGESDFEWGHEQYFDLETNETKNDRSDLTKLFQALEAAESATYLKDIDGALDTAHFLRFSAMEAAVDQWDMYAYTFFYPNNFRIYHDPKSDKLVFLPWGMDLALKPFLYTNRPHISVFELSYYEDNPKQRVSTGLMFRRCLESATCKETYTGVVRDTVKIFDEAKLDAVATKYYDQIKSHVYSETRKELTNAEFDAAVQSVLTTIRSRTAAMRKDLGE